MSRNDGLIVFKDVSFEHDATKPILREASFVIRRGAKLTLMGQNGAGKSTIFSLITGKLRPDEGDINLQPRTTIAISRQIIPRDELELTVRAFFEKCFLEKVYDIDPKIDAVLEVVNLTPTEKMKDTFKDRIVGSFSGGQQARLLLASALIQNPDVLLLDEPTNNLDVAGIEHLTEFLKAYNKTVIVISHDADFLNAFTHGVLYLNVQNRQVEQYQGNYHKVLAEIAARVEKEKRQNAQMAKQIQADKDKINYFAAKGGKMRLIAKKMRADVEEAEESKVDVRKEDKTIREFTIDPHQDIPLEVLKLTEVTVIKNHEPKQAECDIVLKRGEHLQIVGPNGIGKTTLLESLAGGHATGEHIAPGVKIGYYRQDFSNLDFDKTVFETLMASMKRKLEEEMRSIAAGFLLFGDVMRSKVGDLSEGQKGLVAFAKLKMEEPGLLILDEPTNHINFRHIPVIAKALHDYKGAMILVSHVPDFVEKIHIDQVLDLNKLKPKKN
ncbi:MAG: ABC-F family ATP-binding cassette domain-containing protein [Candidatus Kaiserbacteria bacterium]|nr:ABC-F family ATP-binding cassette domain-containing protein [Candidatus Kaiserbacteria bacterium]MCB9816630.1 ABC-F family ATP-binding cassette domain-containing protein [Candidatus Nomurabacteria bacterium]